MSTDPSAPSALVNPNEPPHVLADTSPVASAETALPLMRDVSFWGITATQFLGAFNDNLFKQLLLLLFVAVPLGNGQTADKQVYALAAFSLPFVLFSGFAGFLSDRFSKRRVILICKVAEVGIMLVGVAAFAMHSRVGLSAPMVAWFTALVALMGTHSAFFGPGKYGILPEMFRARDLPVANGIVLMTTFLAIIFGSGLAALLLHLFPDRLWITGTLCVLIAILGTGSALLIRQVQPSSPELPFDPEVLGVPRDIRHLLRADRSLWYALVVSTIFWLSAAIVQPAVNALGERQLNENKLYTGILVTVISAGIAAGSVLAGVASRGKINSRVQKTGAWGMVATLFLLALPGGPKQHLLGYWGSVVDLVLLGAFTGMFAVPLQVFLQSRPPEGQKGRMIATQNLFNWIGICCSTAIYGAGTWLLSLLNVPGNGIFALTALLMLPIALFYRPQSRDLALSAIRE